MGSDEPRHPGEVLSALADEARARVFAAVVLTGPASLQRLASAARLPVAATERALRRLVDSGLVEGSAANPARPDEPDDLVGAAGQLEPAGPLDPAESAEPAGPTGPDDERDLTGPGEGLWRHRPGVLAGAARLAARMVIAPDAGAGASPEDAAVLRAYVVDGRLRSIPAIRHKRLVILDWLSQQFEPGTVYAEVEVNRVLSRAHPDHAALRRFLVDEDLMTRRQGFYWRSGGTFDVP